MPYTNVLSQGGPPWLSTLYIHAWFKVEAIFMLLHDRPFNLHPLLHFISSTWYIFRVQNMGFKKQGAKNRVIVIQKEKKQPVFFASCFLQTIVWTLFLQGQKPTHVFMLGADWLSKYSRLSNSRRLSNKRRLGNFSRNQ